MKMVIMMGLTGAGKSWYSKANYPHYIYVNQDTLGSRDNCIRAVKEALGSNKSVIIDRTNINKKQRSTWINMGLEYNVEEILLIWIDIDAEECLGRMALRKDHPTINNMSLDKMRNIVYSFKKDLEYPELSEGFSKILITRG